MAYFANSYQGECLERQCLKCKYGEEPCPVHGVQIGYNYEAKNNEIAREILDCLVKDDGTCTMYELAKKDLGIDNEK